MRQGTRSKFKAFAEWQEYHEDLEGFGGGACEDATLCNFVVSHGSDVLTKGTHVFEEAKKYRNEDGPFVPAYTVAEWMATSYWRLCHEPAITDRDWGDSSSIELPPTVKSQWYTNHHLSGIGSGFDWPNILFEPDGEKVTVKSADTAAPSVFDCPGKGVFRIDTEELERALQSFIKDTVKQLESSGIKESELHDAWGELRDEIDDPDTALYRRIEAMFGFEPGEGDGQVDVLFQDYDRIGERGFIELASHIRMGNLSGRKGNRKLDVEELDSVAGQAGHGTKVADAFRFSACPEAMNSYGIRRAYQVGREMAKDARREASLNGGPVDNAKLAGMAAVKADVLGDQSPSATIPLTFTSQPRRNSEKLVLKPGLESSRRFDVARVISDRIIAAESERYHFVVDSHNYRQRFQRAFAAEFLCPRDELKSLLSSYSSTESDEEDMIGKYAGEYNVPRGVIMNHIRNIAKEVGDEGSHALGS